MSYSEIPGATNFSQTIELLSGQAAAIRGHEKSNNAGAPSVLVDGLLWIRTDHPTYGVCLMHYNGGTTTWEPVAKLGGIMLRADGSVAAEGNLPMGGYKLTGLAAGAANGDSVRYEQVLLLAGGTMSGALAMGGNKITGLGAATANGDALRFQDKWPDTAGTLFVANPCQLADESDDASTYQQCAGGKVTTFTPRIVELHVLGNVERQTGGTLVAAGVDAHVRGVRHDGDANPKIVGQVGGGAVNVEVEWKFTAPRGVWVRLKRVSDGAYCTMNAGGRVSLVAQFGVGQ